MADAYCGHAPDCGGVWRNEGDYYGNERTCSCGFQTETRASEQIPEREQCPGSGIPPRRRDYGGTKRRDAKHCQHCGEARWLTDDGMVSPHRVYNKHAAKKPKTKRSRSKWDK